MYIHHAAIYTQDLEKQRDFYCKYFGGVSNDGYQNPKTGFASYFVRFEEGASLEIMTAPDVTESGRDTARQFFGYSHLAFSVGSEEEVDRLTALLEQDGFKRISGPRHTGDGYYESCVLDPDGNRVEITV